MSVPVELIKQQINATIETLQSRKQILESHKKQYTNLSFTLDNHAQYTNREQPLLDVRIGPKAIVTGIMPEPKKIMVMLGDDYFVERTPSQAKTILGRRLAYLDSTLAEFDKKVKEAMETLRKIKELETHSLGKEVLNGEAPRAEINEEGLPFMDIREELDEDGSVIDSVCIPTDNGTESVAPREAQAEVTEPELARSLPVMNIIEQLDEDGEIISASVEPESVLQTILQTPAELLQGDQLTRLNRNDEGLPIMRIEEGLDSDKAPALQTPEVEVKGQEDQEQVRELLEDMGIVSEVGTPAENKSESIPSDLGNAPATAGDIITLELIADDFAEEDYSGAEFDDEEWDFESEEDDDDDGLYGSIVPAEGRAQSMFWDQIRAVREKQNPDAKKEPTVVRDIADIRAETIRVNVSQIPEHDIVEELFTRDLPEAETLPKPKKSVSFATNLQVKEIENVSAELKQINHTHVSRFKQNITGKKSVNGVLEDKTAPLVELPALEEDVFENPMLEKVVERAIVETPVIDPTLVEDKPVRLSKFKQSRNENGSTSMRTLSPMDFIASPVENHRPETEVETAAPKKVSKFKQSRTLEPSALDFVTSSLIVEKITLNEPVEGEVISSKVSRFMQSRQSSLAMANVAESPNTMRDVITSLTVNILNPIVDAHEDPAPKLSRFAQTSKSKGSPIPIISNSRVTPKVLPAIPILHGVEGEVQPISNRAELIQSSIDSVEDSKLEEMSSQMVMDVTEKVGNLSIDVPQTVGPVSTAKVSRFKSLRSAERGVLSVANAPISAVMDAAEPHVEMLEKARDHDTVEVMETTLDYQSLQDDMDTMAKAYLLGMYDDDIETEGPIVNELADFEVLNKMVESLNEKPRSGQKRSTKVPLNYSSREFQTDDNILQPQEDYITMLEEDDDRPVMLETIVENVFTDTDGVVDPSEHLLDNDDMLQQEVTMEYQRLRQRMILNQSNTGFRKSDKEMEFEPVDENGDPIKVSRFRAAKLAMHK
ncbi:hypothetical protein BABINDRAFT_159114 [Babjeviella inositovora NRRL Y-12698]|uniref:DUF3835 domain-containing protein n=1 Tax=Babjeviella inositovora NRRL Y-12698 TaxID=984486 RepID=A0A1E3QY20_9ASCO|nr:uncharacterized protein BABINDRAFT_159114 [Babjeviella inositovora NRRL Y-12698]ODQ82550.1 hypothetical protein BABINDRAFT_159114 [Babjeviella inositovora NRRL Y-12698]